jgi:Saxitoxin biosynthesis operon protein SxtJ
MTVLESTLSFKTKPIGSPRSFGLVFTAFFLIVGLSPKFLHHKDPRYWAIALATAIVIVALLRPGLLKYPNLAWLKFGSILHMIINPLVMAILFVFVVLPTAMILRLFGKDVLRLKCDASIDSYWINREADASPHGNMSKQF